jgi:hypothetical protein
MVALLRNMFTGQNAFASGGLLLMVIGGLSVYLRAVPETVWDWLVGQTTMMITVKDDDAAFVWVKEWFLEQNSSSEFGASIWIRPCAANGLHLFQRQAATGSGMAGGRLSFTSIAPRTRESAPRGGLNR